MIIKTNIPKSLAFFSVMYAKCGSGFDTVGFFSLLWNQGLNLEGLGLVKIPVGFINIVAGEKIKLTLYLPE